MSDVVVKNHIYDFMRSENVTEAQQAIGVSSSTELSSVEVRVEELETDYNINKPIWNGAFTTVQANSATWAGGSTDSIVIANSANWNNSYTTVRANSASWSGSSNTVVVANSANWDNTYTTVQSNSAKWNPIYINVKNYGASGNGSNNDYPSIRTAFSQLTANGGGVLYFPAGNYMINSAIEFQNSTLPVTILGDGESSVITAISGLSSTNTGNSPMILAYNSSNIEIKNIILDCRGETQTFPTSGGLPLLYNRAKNKCFAFQYCKNINIDNVNFLNTQQTNEFTICSSIKIQNSKFKNATYRFPLSGLLGTYTGLYYPDSPASQIYASGASLLGFNTCMDVKITGCYFEGWEYDAIAHTVYDTWPSKNFEVHDSTFYNISGSVFAIECYHANTHPISGKLLQNQKYTNNTFINSKYNEFGSGTGISNGVDGVIVSNNTWLDYSTYGVDSWRLGLELNGRNMCISNNIFNNSQLHLQNTIVPYIFEGSVSNNYNITGNIFNSNKNTVGGNGTILIDSISGENVNISDNVFTYLSGMGYRSVNISNTDNIIIDNNIFKKPNIDGEGNDNGVAIQIANAEKIRITNNNIENFSVGLSLPPSNPYKIRNFYIKDNFLKNSGPSYIGEQNIQYGSMNNIGVNDSLISYDINSLTSLTLSTYFPISLNDIFVRNTGEYPKTKILILNTTNVSEISANTKIYNGLTYRLSSMNVSYNSSSDMGIGENGSAHKFYQYNEESFFGENYLDFSLSAKNILMAENYAGYNVGMLSEMIVVNSTPYSDSSKILLPANSIIKSVAVNVSLPPDGVTSFDVGTSSSTSRFLSGLNNTRNSKKVGLLHIPNNTVQTVDERLRITPNTTPLSAGLINVSVFYETFNAPQD